MSRFQVPRARAIHEIEASTVHTSPCCNRGEQAVSRPQDPSLPQHVVEDRNSFRSLQELSRNMYPLSSQALRKKAV